MLKTLKRLPASQPARMTPRAVPKPVVAKAPVLQWVSTAPPSGKRSFPKPPIFRLISSSSWYMRWASANRRSGMPKGSGSLLARLTIRCTAQKRLTAVGRAAAMREAASSSSDMYSSGDVALISRAAMAMA